MKQLILRWRNDPVLFVIDAFGVEPEEWQKKALRAVAENDSVSIRSGHGVGKSAFSAWVILWFITTRYPAKIPCTAPTAHQLNDVLWAEVAKWHRKMIKPLADLIEVKSDSIELKEAPKESFAVARTARKENPDAFQGFHSENLLFVVDEASGVEEIIFVVGEGAMSTKGAKRILVGNPTKTSGYFYNTFHKDRAAWFTMKVSCEDSSRVDRAFIDDMARRYGVDSNIYRVRVLGEFPNSDSNSVIPLHLCEEAVNRDVAEPVDRHRMVWGLDVARFGDDSTALIKRRGNFVKDPVRWRGKDLMQTCGLVMQEWNACDHLDRPQEILVDVIGMGAGVVDRLRELNLPVRGINVAESSSVSERYMRLRDELWFKAREWLEARDCKLPDNQELIAELTMPSYQITSSGKIKVEGKEEMKSRGFDSPDLADAFCLTFAAGYTVIPQEEIDRYRSSQRLSSVSAWAV